MHFCIPTNYQKHVPLIISSKRIKYLETNLTKEVKDPYTEKCKTQVKGIKFEIFHSYRWKKNNTVKIFIQSAIPLQWDFSQKCNKQS